MLRPADQRPFRYHDASILVCSADGDSLDWLEAFLAPSFDEPSAAHAWKDEVAGGATPIEYRVDYVVDLQRFTKLRRDIADRSTGLRSCFVLDAAVVRLPAVQDDERTMLLDAAHGWVLIAGSGSIEIVADPAAATRRLPLLRAVREIAAEAWRRYPGHLQLHAAALAVGDAVVLLAGAKNAGKTTSLVHALDRPGARLVANDRVGIRLDADRVFVRGMPTIVSIRSGTLERFPALLHGLPASSFPWSLNDAEWRAARNAADVPPNREHLRLSPARFAKQLGRNLVAGGRLGAILICSLDPDLPKRSVTRLRPREARAALATCLYGGGAPRVEPTVIETLVGGVVADDLAVSLDALAASIPVFECRLGPGAYDEPFDLGAFPAGGVRQAADGPDIGMSLATLSERLGAEVIEVRPQSSSSGLGTTPRVHRVALADGRVVKVRRLDDHSDLLECWGDTLIEEWIDGQPLADPPGDDALAQAGDLLGRLHARERLDGVAVHRTVPTTRDLWRIERDLAIITSAEALDAETGRRLLAAAVDCDPGETMIGMCHLDFCGENMVLDRRGRLRVVDNATMSVAALDFDLQRTAYRWGLAAERWDVFLRAYRAHREPHLTDQSALFWRLRAVAVSARFRVAGRAASASVPLAELSRLSLELAGRAGAR
jgi:Phosphotransferase enzyme family